MRTAIRVFVYGTLKRGEPNHQVLSTTAGTHRLVGFGRTRPLFPLVVATRYNIPFLLADSEPGSGNRIHGEVYEVDEIKLEILDELEAYPTLYDRRLVEIELQDGTDTTAYVYMIKKWRPDILAVSTVMMDNYSSKGPHGREYVERYARAKDMLEDDGYNLYAEIQGVSPNDEETIALTKKKANRDLDTAN